MDSFEKKLAYFDEVQVGKNAFKGDDLSNFLLTILMSIISDNRLTLLDIKILVAAINYELQDVVSEP